MVISALLSVVMISTLLYFASFLTGFKLGIDILLQALNLPLAEGISPNTATCFLLIAIALLTCLHGSKRLAAYAAQGMILVALGLAIFAVGVYAFSLQTLTTITWFRTMALHTALMMIVLVLSVFLLHPEWNIAKRVRGASRAILLSLGVMLILLAATGFFWQLTIANTVNRAESRFQADANSLETAVINELTKYVNALHGARGLFAASAQVNRVEWKAYVDNLGLRQNFPGMSGLGFYANDIPATN